MPMNFFLRNQDFSLRTLFKTSATNLLQPKKRRELISKHDHGDATIDKMTPNTSRLGFF
jgi:hypothetical protein